MGLNPRPPKPTDWEAVDFCSLTTAMLFYVSTVQSIGKEAKQKEFLVYPYHINCVSVFSENLSSLSVGDLRL